MTFIDRLMKLSPPFRMELENGKVLKVQGLDVEDDFDPKHPTPVPMPDYFKVMEQDGTIWNVPFRAITCVRVDNVEVKP